MNRTPSKFLLLGLILAVFLDIGSFFMPMPIYTPFLLHSHTLGAVSLNNRTIMLGILIACYGLAQLIGAPILGDLSDQYGRKRILLLALTSSLIGSLLGGISLSTGSISLIYLSRLIIGLSSGTIAVVFACTADYSTEETRAKNLGYVGIGAALGAAFGPVLGGHFASTQSLAWFGYATPFYLMALLYLASIALLAYFLPHDTIKTGRTAINLFTGLRKIQTVAKSSLLLRRLIIMGFLFQVGAEGFYLLAPILGVKRFELLPADIGNHFLLQAVISGVVSVWLNKYLSEYYDSAKIYLFNVLLLSIGFLFLFTHSHTWFYIPFVAIGIFGTLCWIHINNLFSQAATKEEQGLIFGISQSLWSIGGIIGAILVAVTTVIHNNLSILVPICFEILSLVLAIMLIAMKKTRAE